VLTGANVFYTIKLFNSRATVASNVVVTDVLPNTVSFISCTASGSGICGGSGNNRTISYAQLGGNATETITITANVNCAVPDGTSISNLVSVASATPDGDAANNTAAATVTADNPPPLISNFAISPTTLWPPNHRLRPVRVSYTVTDNCGTPNVQLTVSSDEPQNGAGDGNTAADWQVVDANNALLRAERAGGGDGRTYTLTITATDSGGGSSSASGNVLAPHNAN
jgi:uncharacterized repeat protein (TIGR01451 family)